MPFKRQFKDKYAGSSPENASVVRTLFDLLNSKSFYLKHHHPYYLHHRRFQRQFHGRLRIFPHFRSLAPFFFLPQFSPQLTLDLGSPIAEPNAHDFSFEAQRVADALQLLDGGSRVGGEGLLQRALWTRITKNTDGSTGPLDCLFARSLAPLTSLTPELVGQ